MIESQDHNEKMGGNKKGKTDVVNSKTPVFLYTHLTLYKKAGTMS